MTMEMLCSTNTWAPHCGCQMVVDTFLFMSDVSLCSLNQVGNKDDLISKTKK